MTTEYSLIGKRLPTIDGPKKATGAAKFTADFALPHMLIGKVLRSPYPHARILNIDTSRAEKLPGVKAVVVGKEFGSFKRGILSTTRDESPLAVDKVRYIGEGLAGVAAIDGDVADEALQLIKVDYEQLPAVYDPIEAMKPGAPQVHNHVKNNMSWECHFNFGDIDKAFKESYYVQENRFTTGKVLHGFMEPYAVLADWDPTGAVTLWASKQCPYFLWRHMGLVFNLPLDKVRVIQPYVGGGFGGKNNSFDLDYCAVMLSKKTGRPVKITWSQQDMLTSGRRRHNFIMDMKTGVKRDGTLTAIHCKAIGDGGSATATGPITYFLAGALLSLPYRMPNFRFDGYRVFTNKPVSVALRGHGRAHTIFASEVQMDMIAKELGIDPVDLRLKNAVDPGHVTVNKLVVKSCGLKECIDKVATSVNWKDRESKKSSPSSNVAKGMGFACYSFVSGQIIHDHNACAAVIKVNEDGTINLATGATDIGQGSNSILSTIAAEEMGISLDDVRFSMIDTAFTPVDAGSYASRVTYIAGNAVQLAAIDAKKQLAEIAARKLGAKPEDIVFKDRQVSVKGDTKKGMTFKQLTRICDTAPDNRVILGRGSYSFSEAMRTDVERAEGNASEEYSFGAQVAEVEVDKETGQITLVHSTLAHDCGRALNPMAVEGQLEGAAIMGQGQALQEDFILDGARTLNTTFRDYKMPRSMDAAPIKGIDVETEVLRGPFGAKEAGEGIILSTVPAIVSAIHDATGVWFTDLPVTAEKVVAALRKKKEE